MCGFAHRIIKKELCPADLSAAGQFLQKTAKTDKLKNIYNHNH
jgi:hypothetical protein